MFGPDGLEKGASTSLFNPDHLWQNRKLADSTPEAAIAVMEEVKALILDERFSQAKGVNHALRDLASTCDMFLKIAGARVSAVATE